jgi:hypothetical protein
MGQERAWMFKRRSAATGSISMEEVNNKPEHLDGLIEGVNKFQVENYNC